MGEGGRTERPLDRLSGSGLGAPVVDRISAWRARGDAAAASAEAEWLLHIGCLSLAEASYRALAERFAERPVGRSGLAQCAAHRELWDLALARWRELIAAFPTAKAPHWRLGEARALEELGREGEGVSCLEGVQRDYGDSLGLAYRAQRAARKRRWDEVLGLAERMIAAAPPEVLASARLLRATALFHGEQFDAAEAEGRDILAADPWRIHPLLLVMRVLAETGRFEEAGELYRGSPFADSLAPAALSPRVEIALRAHRLDEARALLTRYREDAASVETCELLFAFTPRVYENAAKREIWRALERRLGEVIDGREIAQQRAALRLRCRIKFALRQFAQFRRLVGRAASADEVRVAGLDMRSLAARPLTSGRRVDERPKVFGVGLTRTGTTTLAAALNRLGVATIHWTNPLTNELISNVDFSFFDAFNDTPVCVEFERYYEQFPNSKFILTTRPLESWKRSFLRHWRRAHGLDDFAAIRAALKQGGQFPYGRRFEKLQLALFFRHRSAEEAFAFHERRVRDFFRDKPPGRFLVFNVFEGDGWPQLCAFLRLATPSEPFPFENAAF